MGILKGGERIEENRDGTGEMICREEVMVLEVSGGRCSKWKERCIGLTGLI